MTDDANRHSLRVVLGRRGYDIAVGEGLLAVAGGLIKPLLASPRAIVVTDANVGPLYLAALEASLGEAAIDHDAVVLAAGEKTKDIDHLARLTDSLLEMKIDRATTLIALGGGVVGDLAGFAAAITLRGLDYVQIPTTLLSQVDSSVGGKTGINTAAGKNLIGAFHQPIGVLADTATLASLPRRQLLAGYAEVVKYALIGDRGFFAWLEGNFDDLLDGAKAALRHAVLTCCAAKAAIVAEDERESGRRAMLNLGHTFAHALEAQSGYTGELLHGEAVAVGMVLAFELSVRLGLCPAADRDRVRRHLAEAGLPANLSGLADPSWSAASLAAHMEKDKKVKAGRTTFILARGIGKAFIAEDVDRADVLAVLEDALGA